MSELDELIAIFRLEAGELLGGMAAALCTQCGNLPDREAIAVVQRIAHNLKGAALTVGAQRIVEPCETLESEVRAASAEDELPGSEQIESWLRAVTDMFATLGDPDVIPDTSFAAAALARAGFLADAAEPTGPQFAATRTDSSAVHPSTPPAVARQACEHNSDAIAQSPAARGRILVVDDSLIVRTVEAQVLGNEGYDVTACADGEEAWALLEQQGFDLVICDVQMPKLDGFGLTSRIKTCAALHHLPVLLVTGRAAPEDITRGAQAGADGYVTKADLEQTEFTAVVRRLLG